MTALLVLDDVHQRYETGGHAVQALAGIDLTVSAGELVVVVGPSGSGKSSLLDVMGALHRPTSGGVRIAGVDVTRLGDGQLAALRAHRIGFVFQQFHLLEGLTAAENVATGLLYRGLSGKERARRADEALHHVGLADRREHRPDQLSGGERQRVAVARALVGDPAIMLADEPTGNLDSATGEHIIELLLELHRNGTTMVVITHDEQLAGRFPRRVELRDGSVVLDVEVGSTRGDLVRRAEMAP